MGRYIYIYIYIYIYYLWQASENGGNALNFAAIREKIYLPDFEHYDKAPISSEFMEMSDIDFNAKDTMIKSKSNLKDYGTPYKSTGNGNCLFNSISSSLCGNETLATELRLRTAVEMITNAEVYTSRQDYDKIYDYSPSFDEAMLACCDDGEFSSIWNLMALANVIGSPIQFLYPRMNSEKDEAHLWLSVLACDENTKDRTR